MYSKGRKKKPVTAGLVMEKGKRPQLRIIRKTDNLPTIGMLKMGVACPDDFLRADAVVLEEDTWLILSAPGFTIAKEHPIRLFTQLLDAQPLIPGTVLIRQERPLILSAVIHDFSASPCCRPEWVAVTLSEIFRFCRERNIQSLVLPLFGVCHGKLTHQEVVAMIISMVRLLAPENLKLLHLAAPPGAAAEVRRLIVSGAEG